MRITTEGQYIIYKDGIPFGGKKNTLGELTVTEALDDEPDNLDPSPPTRWGWEGGF